MPWCSSCQRSFVSQSALTQHLLNSSYHAWCQHCNEEFDSRDDLEDHWLYSIYHSWSNFCDIHFQDQEDLDDHKDDEHYFADCCDLWLSSKSTYNKHMNDNHHWCSQCDRIFNSSSNLNSHLNSSIHKPKTFKCPFCPKLHISVSATVSHLETGTCKSGITRKMIDDYIARTDKSNIITHPNRLITNGSSSNSMTHSKPIPKYEASERSWNGHSYGCYFCSCEFPYLAQLNQHLNSPKHSKRDQKMYRCPGNGCSVSTETFSGIIQHVEMGGCGVRHHAVAKATMDRVMTGLSTLRLQAA